MRTIPLNTLFLAVLPFIASSLAQNSTTSSTCLNQNFIDQLRTGYVNSTGSAQFSWLNSNPSNNIEDPWQISVYVNDTHNNTINGRPATGWDIEIPAQLSVPETVRDVSVCICQFNPVNASSTGNNPDGSVGCAGVLSNACSTHITEYLRNTSSTTGGCELPGLRDEAYRRYMDACGENLVRLTLQRLDVAQTNCSLPSPPGIEVPDNYITFESGGSIPPIRSEWLTANVSSNYTYDLAVNQPAIFGLVASFEGLSAERPEAQVVCVTPSNVSAGSRIPESRTPWEKPPSSGGGGTSAGSIWRAGGWLSAVVAGMLALALIL